MEKNNYNTTNETEKSVEEKKEKMYQDLLNIKSFLDKAKGKISYITEKGEIIISKKRNEIIINKTYDESFYKITFFNDEATIKYEPFFLTYGSYNDPDGGKMIKLITTEEKQKVIDNFKKRIKEYIEYEGIQKRKKLKESDDFAKKNNNSGNNTNIA